MGAIGSPERMRPDWLPTVDSWLPTVDSQPRDLCHIAHIHRRWGPIAYGLWPMAIGEGNVGLTYPHTPPYTHRPWSVCIRPHHPSFAEGPNPPPLPPFRRVRCVCG